MPLITNQPRRNGSLVVTEFVDSVGTNNVTFSIPDNIEQETLQIYNISPVELLVNVGTQSNVSVPAYRGITLNETFTAFSIKSSLGVGGFRATCSYQDSDEEDEIILDDKITALTTSLVQKASQSDISVNPKWFGASGSKQSTTGTINAGSNQLTLASAIDFKDGQGIAIAHAGTPCALVAPDGLAISNVGQAGTTTYSYQVVALDANGGCSTASSAITTTTSKLFSSSYADIATAMNYANYNSLSWSPVSGAVSYAIYGRGKLLGTTPENTTTFYDFGVDSYTNFWNLPTTIAPSTSLAGTLVAEIVAGGGTNTLTLSTNAITSVTTQAVQHDDTQALTDTFNFAFPLGRSIKISEGVYNTTSPLIWDIDHQYEFNVDMEGVLKPQSGLGTALTVKRMTGGRLQLRVNDGGCGSDTAFCINNVASTDVKVFGLNYAGTVWKVMGSYEDANNYVSTQNTVEVFATQCGRALIHGPDSGHTDSFGAYKTIWDQLCSHGSLFKNSYDITILHYENLFRNITESSLTFNTCGSLHLGTIALGGLSNGFVNFISASNASIQKLFLTTNDMVYGTSYQSIGLKASTSSNIIVTTAVIAKCLDAISYDNSSTITILDFEPSSCTNIIRKNGVVLDTTNAKKSLHFETIKSVASTVIDSTMATGNVGIEHGSISNATTPFLDWHSSGFVNDYDIRFMASGGTNGSNGGGDLTVTAANFKVSGAIQEGGVTLDSKYAKIASPTFTGTVALPVATTTGNLTVGGSINSSSTMSLTGANQGVEVGSTSTVGTPYLDFHSSGSANDFDARIMASGGTDGTNGQGNLNFSANIQLNSGTALKGHLSATASLSGFGSIPAQGSAIQTITVSGASIGDNCYVSPNADIGAGLVWSAWVSAGSTITVRVSNPTAGAITPTTATWRADLWKH
ncbi:hypothetical protein QF028_004374 [Neobacillus sp. B4I6]|uniref:hypothetical protein n=1 Tax=Neobacillus sp. B4I6 TaxID=3373925 RepID=UPI003D258088